MKKDFLVKIGLDTDREMIKEYQDVLWDVIKHLESLDDDERYSFNKYRINTLSELYDVLYIINDDDVISGLEEMEKVEGDILEQISSEFKTS